VDRILELEACAMNSDEQNLNINLGLDRNTSDADRQRAIDHMRAEAWGNSSSGSWSPPGGFGILWGLVRSASRSKPQRQARPSSASGRGRLMVVAGGILGAIVANKTGNPWLVGALIGAVVGACARQIVTMVKWGVALALIALFVGAYNNRPQEATEAQLYQDAADRFVDEYNASQGLPPADQTYDTIDAIPAAPAGWKRIVSGEVVERSDGTTATVYRPVYVREE